MIRKFFVMAALVFGLAGNAWADARVAIEIDNQTNKIMFVEFTETDPVFSQEENSYVLIVSAKQKKSEVSYLEKDGEMKLVKISDGLRESNADFQLPYKLQETEEPNLPKVHKIQITDRKGKLFTKIVN
jgi:hypothetical protein